MPVCVFAGGMGRVGSPRAPLWVMANIPSTLLAQFYMPVGLFIGKGNGGYEAT